MKKFLIKTSCSLVILVSFAFPGVTYAFCSSPYAPDPPSTFMKPTKPNVPWCVDEYSRTHTCDDWEINSYYNDLDSYRNEVEDYVRQLKDFIYEAEAFYSEAVAYANCEISNLE